MFVALVLSLATCGCSTTKSAHAEYRLLSVVGKLDTNDMRLTELVAQGWEVVGYSYQRAADNAGAETQLLLKRRK